LNQVKRVEAVKPKRSPEDSREGEAGRLLTPSTNNTLAGTLRNFLSEKFHQKRALTSGNGESGTKECGTTGICI
jgi:hypothetical protein